MEAAKIPETETSQDFLTLCENLVNHCENVVFDIKDLKRLYILAGYEFHEFRKLPKKIHVHISVVKSLLVEAKKNVFSN